MLGWIRLSLVVALVSGLSLSVGCKGKEDDEMTGLRPKAGVRAAAPGGAAPIVNTPTIPSAPPPVGIDSDFSDDDDDDDSGEEDAPPLTTEAAKNHPYSKQLVTSMRDAWSPPSGASGTVTGCIRINPAGRVVSRMVRKTGNAALETSVTTALDGFDGLGKRIPKRLVPRLNGWVCAKFTPPKSP